MLCTFLVAVVLPSRLRCIAWLPCVLVRFPRTICGCSGEGFSQDCFVLVSAVVVPPQSMRCIVGLAGAFWRVFPRGMPWWFWWRSASCLFRATIVFPLWFEVWDAKGFGVLSWHRPDSPLSHCLSLRWFRSHIVVSGVRPQLGQGAVWRVLCVLWRLYLALARGQR
ncbi:hypothetical protein Taro_019115 [Colocasia esculenta]|uniref:Secreted protein n=1 Tax=Colocasia esculenta TaxID=4460 RepID=A0A843USK3_COLES|nr:hypothetical protein [Colocasia esculenta]